MELHPISLACECLVAKGGIVQIVWRGVLIIFSEGKDYEEM